MLGDIPRDWHANAQIPCGDSHATLDVLHKSGSSDAGRVSAWGGTLNYDWPRWFARLAYDPYQNFSAQSAVNDVLLRLDNFAFHRTTARSSARGEDHGFHSAKKLSGPVDVRSR